jgi:hypothetical protein
MKPYQIRRIGNRIVEVISYPFPGNDKEPDKKDRVNVRMMPGDATSMQTVSVHQIQVHPVLSKHSGPLFVHYAKAKGRGYFPVDMLRTTGACLEKNGDIIAKFPADSEVLIYQVTTGRQVHWYADRWKSFDWEIQPISTQMLRNE